MAELPHAEAATDGGTPCREPIRVKICGVTDARDARLAIDLGAAFVGVNFYRPSPRFVDLERAREIRDRVPPGRLVGVFVNLPPSEVERMAEGADLDWLQFHGDEPASEIAPFAERAIRAIRPRSGRELEDAVGGLSEDLWALLVDAPHERLFGGTGERWDYTRAAAVARRRRVFVAGGIDASNVATAVRAVPDLFAVDVCSGVEKAPGKKDAGRMESLFAALEQCAGGANGDLSSVEDSARAGSRVEQSQGKGA